MNITSMRNAISTKVGRQILKTQKHSPTILFGAGVVGVVATTVMASRATLQLHEVLDEAQTNLRTIEESAGAAMKGGGVYDETAQNRDRGLVFVQTSVKIAKLYGPTLIVGALSIGALAGSHNILSKRNGALTAAYVGLDKAFAAYRERVVAEQGEEKDRQFYFGSEEKEVIVETETGPQPEKQQVSMNRDGLSIYSRVWDQTSASSKFQKGWGHQNQMFIQCQENYMNQLLSRRGHVFLNEVYDSLGLDRTKEGSVVGWVLGNGDDHIDFGIMRNNVWNAMRFVNGDENGVILDFNVDGVIYDKI